jgi:hypothetical protein
VPTEFKKNADSTPPSDYYIALRRVIYTACLGAAFIFIYGLSFAQEAGGVFLRFLSVGLMAAGAAILSGGLLGFLFGVPHTKEGEAPPAKTEGRDDALVRPETTNTSVTYVPNTSLEQISDWLTKMLVGVGLIEIKAIPDKLKGIASYVAKGLGNEEQTSVFALLLLIFFSVCGFVFGFLWARLYLKRWFIAADQNKLEVLGKKLDQLEEDAHAVALISRELISGHNGSPADPREIAEAIKAASPAIRAQIFAQAEAAAEDEDADDYETRLQASISIFRALIASDPRGHYDRNHQELSQALQRQELPNLQEAVKEITKAIEIRNKRGKPGWEFYEFLRALEQIQQDQNYKNSQGSDPALVNQIVGDLRHAFKDVERWPSWLEDDPDVEKWMTLNKIDIAILSARA